MSKLKIETKDNGTYLLEGEITEDADLGFFEKASSQEILLDLNQVTFINSCGIRDWIEAQAKFQGHKIVYENCPQVIVEQMNMVKGFIANGGEVKSFYAPYYNEKTDQEVKILIDPSEVKDSKAPVKKADDGTELEFDDIELQYFSFLKNQ